LLLLIDNFDSFTFNLFDYFRQLGQEVKVVRNDELSVEELAAIECEGVIISPGPGTPQDSKQLMDIVTYFHDKKPILGICLGHQALGMFFGAKLEKAAYPMHGKVSRIQTIPHPMWHDLPETMNVCRYHSLLIRNPENTSLLVTATAVDDQAIMAFAHRELPIWGLQFHPEAILTEHGLDILHNWLNAFILQPIETRIDTSNS
jgi:anthranilate synthase component 2